MPKKVEFFLLLWKVVLANPFAGVRTYMRGILWVVGASVKKRLCNVYLTPRSFICSEWRRVSSGFPVEAIIYILAKKPRNIGNRATEHHNMKHAMLSHMWDEQKLFFCHLLAFSVQTVGFLSFFLLPLLSPEIGVRGLSALFPLPSFWKQGR